MNTSHSLLAPLALSVVATFLQACGSGPTSTSLNESWEKESGLRDTLNNSSYVVAKDITVRTEGDDAGSAKEVYLREGTELSILGTRVDPLLGSMIRLGIDGEEAEESDIWVVMNGELLGALAHLGSEEVAEEKEGIVHTVRRARRGMTYCYRFVKNYLLSTGKVRTYLPGSSAWQAANVLPKHGFRRTGNSPANAENGEVCVYAGGPRGHGHIEVKRNGKWWYGYGFKSEPISDRRFIGCFSK
jgi:hypothetical protein